jgi:hypothetical protein
VLTCRCIGSGVVVVDAVRVWFYLIFDPLKVVNYAKGISF